MACRALVMGDGDGYCYMFGMLTVLFGLIIVIEDINKDCSDGPEPIKPHRNVAQGDGFMSNICKYLRYYDSS